MKKLILKYLRDFIPYIIGASLLVIAQTYIQFVLLIREMKNMLEQGALVSSMTVIRQSGVKMLAYTGILVLCTIGVTYFTSKISGTMVGRLRYECYRKALAMNPEEFERFGCASVLTRTVGDPRSIVALMQFLVSRLLILPVALCCILIIMFITSRTVFWAFLISVLACVAILLLFKMRAQKHFGEFQKRIDHFNRTVAEKITGVRTIRSFSAEEYEEKNGLEDDRKIMQAAVKANRPLYFMNPLSLLVLDCTTVSIFLILGKEIQNNAIAVSNLIVVFQYLSFCIMVLALIPSLVNLLPKAIISSARVLELLESSSAGMNECGGAFSEKDGTGTVEFRDVSFEYENGRKALEHISFTLEGGKTLAVVGATGSGKTTLLSLLLGLYQIKEGDIFINGVSISNISKKEILRQCSYATQKDYILRDTIRGNITAFHDEISEEEIMHACRCACFEDVISTLPDGLDTVLLQNGVNLSGGQRKRLILARAFVRKAGIYLLDEPYASLDAITGKRVRQNIEEELKNKTVIVISSRITDIMDADRILVLDSGRIAGLGNHETLLKSCDLYKELFDMQCSLEGEE